MQHVPVRCSFLMDFARFCSFSMYNTDNEEDAYGQLDRHRLHGHERRADGPACSANGCCVRDIPACACCCIRRCCARQAASPASMPNAAAAALHPVTGTRRQAHAQRDPAALRAVCADPGPGADPALSVCVQRRADDPSASGCAMAAAAVHRSFSKTRRLPCS